MTGSTTPVGEAIATAIRRAAELESGSTLKLRVRVVADDGEGLTIRARVAAENNEQLEAQDGKGVRNVPWTELDARLADLVRLVEEAASEVEEAYRTAPSPPPRPSQAAEDLEQEAYEALILLAFSSMSQTLKPLMDEKPAGLNRATVAEAMTIAALRFAAMAGHGARISAEDLQRMLRWEIRELRARVKDAGDDAPPFRLHS